MSQKELGTTVTLNFPRGKSQAAIQKTKKIRNEPNVNTISEHTNFRILVVEDNPANQAIIAQQLTYLNYKVTIAGDGIEGYQKHKANHHDLILMDCNMPKMNGYQLTEKIRAEEKGLEQHIPIIAFTANAYNSMIDIFLLVMRPFYMLMKVHFSG